MKGDILPKKGKKGTGYFFWEKENCFYSATVHREKAACMVKVACPLFSLFLHIITMNYYNIEI